LRKLKIGIIGCGKQAGKHIASLNKIPWLELVLVDKDAYLARKLAEQTGGKWVTDPEDVLRDGQVEAVVVCTPTQTHVPLITEAVQAGKHVFCEKPLADSLNNAKGLLETVGSSGRIVLLGYLYRYVPIFEEGFRIFRDQTFNGKSLVMGKPLNALFRLGGRGSHQVWKHQKASGGGAINEMLVHMIDLANWYFGPLHEVEVLSCDCLYPERRIQGKNITVDTEDYIMMKCRSLNGMEIFCQADLITPAFTQYVEIQSENGTFMGSIQPDMPSYVFLKEDAGGFGAGKTELRYGRRNVLDIQMLYFYHCILRQELPDRNTIEDSLELMRVTNSVAKQAERILENRK
jgi:predicted dehydrogenase